MEQNERPRVNGFRLTWQILGTLVFLGVLGIILFPVFETAGWPATRVSCLSNMKQLGVSTAIYASDNNEAVPPNFSFDGSEIQTKYVDAVFPYCKNKDTFLCIKEQGDIKKKGTTPSQEGIAGKMDYVHCLSLRGIIPEFSTGKRTLDLPKIKDPAAAPYLRDPIRGYGTAKDNKVIGFLSPHGGGFNTGFLDAHAKYVRNPNINTDL